MEFNYIIKIIPLLVGGGIAGYFIKYLLDKKSESETRIFQDKKDHYRTLILCIKSLSEDESKHMKLLLFEYMFLWLYAPDNVINSANKLLLGLKNNSDLKKIDKNILGELIVNIRLDMGIKTNLKSNDLYFK
jgi:hypothetical protein